MSILSFIVIVALVGMLLWAVNTYLPIEPGVKKFLNIAVIILLVIWFISALGILPGLETPIGRPLLH